MTGEVWHILTLLIYELVRECKYSQSILAILYLPIHVHTCTHLFSHTAEANSKIRTLERTSKSLKNEKAVLQEEITSLRDQVAEKDKDLRGVKGELRELQDDNSRLTEKLTDIRAQKTKFSRLAREKAEEMGERERESERFLSHLYVYCPS